jgi:hypothetical protein
LHASQPAKLMLARNQRPDRVRLGRLDQLMIESGCERIGAAAALFGAQ